MAKQILFDEKARSAIKKGIDKLAEAVRMTLGPKGRAVLIEKGYGAPQVTFDGVTVAKEIELKDKYENLGAEFIKQAADKTDNNVGDGTTTSVILAHAIIEEGERVIKEKGFNVILLADYIKKASEEVIKKLEKQRELINDKKKVEEVATLSAKDEEIGKLIAEVMEKIGKEGVVTVEDSNTIGNSYEIVEGMQFDRGYISPYMITNQERMEAVLNEPFILITDRKISAVNDLLPVLEKLMQSGKKELLIVAEDVEGEALATLILNKLRGVFNVLAVKAPGFGDRKKEMLQDIAIVTGAELISEDLGKKLENIELEELGKAHRVIADKDKTTIVGGMGNKDEIAERIKQIKAQIKITDSEFDKEKLEERLGKLAGGIAVIKVGAPTESAQKELKQRVEDAVGATRAAVEEGIIPGGGMGLFNIHLDELAIRGENKEVIEAAVSILKKAMLSPVRAIIQNSGESADRIIEKLREHKTGGKNIWFGFNAVTNKLEDLKEAGVVDPLKVTKFAFINAVSVAANYLVLGAAITDLPEKKQDTREMGEDYSQL
jgi:chaperonin GroEL